MIPTRTIIDWGDRIVWYVEESARMAEVHKGIHLATYTDPLGNQTALVMPDANMDSLVVRHIPYKDLYETSLTAAIKANQINFKSIKPVD